MDVEGRKALRPAVATARAVLRDMDSDAVPQRLRKVAASSARNLPPPLERSVFDLLTDDEDFRSSVRERWTDDGGSDRLVTAFLEDPSSVDAELAAHGSTVPRVLRECGLTLDQLPTGWRRHQNVRR